MPCLKGLKSIDYVIMATGAVAADIQQGKQQSESKKMT
jgi:hypothetical protein